MHEIRLVRLYPSPKGIWRYEIERGGVIHWSSLHTRNEGEARRKYDALQRVLSTTWGKAIAALEATPEGRDAMRNAESIVKS